MAVLLPLLQIAHGIHGNESVHLVHYAIIVKPSCSNYLMKQNCNQANFAARLTPASAIAYYAWYA